MAKNQVTLTFAGDTKSLDSAFHKLQAQSDTTKSKFSGLATGAKIAAGVFLTGLAVAAKGAFDGLKSGQKVAAQTEAVIKSTGGAANITASQVDALAIALSNKSGVDDELIAKGQNVLLTFTNIRNEVGKGNNIFTQATKTALDMSVALGQDLKGSNIQLGKALNDPIRGISALSKVGVTFTTQQRNQIKALQDSGNVMGAQKIILKELQREFGGSAQAAGQTLGGQLEVAKLKFERLAEEVLVTVLPALNGMVGVISTVVGWLSQHETTTKVLVAALTGLSVIVLTINKVIAAGTAIKAAYGAITALVTTQTAAQTAATTGATAAQTGLNTAMRANVIGAVITAIALLAAGLVLAWKNSETFRDITKKAFDLVKTAGEGVKTAIQAIPGAIQAAKDNPVVQGIVTFYTAQFRLIKAAVELVASAVRAIIDAVEDAKNSKALSGIQTAFGNAFSAIKSVINSVADAISNVISKAQSAINWIGQVKSAASKIGGPSGIDLVKRFLADGGVVTSPTVSMVGEAGPEVVIPLTRPQRARELMEQTGLANGTSQGSGPTIHIAQMVVSDQSDIYRISAQLGRQLSMAS